MKQFATDMFNGGTEGQVFGKNSNADFDMGWRDTGGEGGAAYKRVYLSNFEIFNSSGQHVFSKSIWLNDVSAQVTGDVANPEGVSVMCGRAAAGYIDESEVASITAKDVPDGIVPLDICYMGPFYSDGGDGDIFAYAYDAKFNNPVTDRGNYFDYGLEVTMNEDVLINPSMQSAMFGIDAETGAVTLQFVLVPSHSALYRFHNAIRMILFMKDDNPDCEIYIPDKDAALLIELKSGARLWVTCNVSDTPPTI